MFASKGGVTTLPFGGPASVLGHLVGKRGPSGFGASSTAEEVARNWDGKGKTVLITGAGTGLGLESARVLAARGADVILAVRDVSKGEAAAAQIASAHPGSKVGVLQLDLTSLQSVKEAAEKLKAERRPLHVLMLNAGVMACPFGLTKEGHELQFGTNHLGHFALVRHLEGSLEATARASGEPGRVIVLSSMAHWNTYKGGLRPDAKIDDPEGYNPWPAYGQSKLCNILFARELQRRWSEAGKPLVAVSCHPGAVPSSELMRHMTIPGPVKSALKLAFRPFSKTIPQGAATQTYLATSPAVKQLGGEYFADSNVGPSSPFAHEKALATRLWALSERLCGFA